MTYVGAVPTTGDFKLLDSITTSSTTTFNLRQGGVAVYPQSANHCIVQLNGVNQVPTSSFNIVNDTIVFSEALTSSDVINQILVLGNVNDIGVPSDDTVSTAKIQADAINATKIADDSISDEHLDNTAITGQTAITSLADTDKFLVSDASDSGNLKYVEKQYLPSGTHVKLLGGTASSSVNHDFQNFMDATKYNTYLVNLTEISNGSGNNQRIDLNFIANTTVLSGAVYWGAVLGYRSGDAQAEDAYESATIGKLGQKLILNDTLRGNNRFHINVDSGRPMGVNVFGANWGYNSSWGDFMFTNYTIGYNTTDTITGMRLFESGGNATVFDYEIYGILK